MASVPAAPAPTPGGVVEWLMAPVLKTGEVKASAGSNPAPSVLLVSPSGDTRAACGVLVKGLDRFHPGSHHP